MLHSTWHVIAANSNTMLSCPACVSSHCEQTSASLHNSLAAVKYSQTHFLIAAHHLILYPQAEQNSSARSVDIERLKDLPESFFLLWCELYVLESARLQMHAQVAIMICKRHLWKQEYCCFCLQILLAKKTSHHHSLNCCAFTVSMVQQVQRPCAIIEDDVAWFSWSAKITLIYEQKLFAAASQSCAACWSSSFWRRLPSQTHSLADPAVAA